MTWPISSSRSASVLVSAAVWARNEPIVAPWPWNAWISWPDSALTCVGIQRPEQRTEPADQRVQVQRRLGVDRQRDGLPRLQPS